MSERSNTPKKAETSSDEETKEENELGASPQVLKESGHTAVQRMLVATKHDRLNLRAQPSIHGHIVGELERGSAVETTGPVEDGYVHVKSEGREGWSAQRYLQPDPASQPEIVKTALTTAVSGPLPHAAAVPHAPTPTPHATQVREPRPFTPEPHLAPTPPPRASASASPLPQARPASQPAAERETRPSVEAAASEREVQQPAAPSTIASLANVDAFATAFHHLQAQWPELTIEQRFQHLASALRPVYAMADVPVPEMRMNSSDAYAGGFDSQHWLMLVDDQPLKSATLTTEDAARLGATFMHESRHAEQYFTIARMSAGTPRAASLHGKIPAWVLAEAARRPIDKHSELAQKSEAWYQSIYGDTAGMVAYHKPIEDANARLKASLDNYHLVKNNPSSTPQQKAAAVEEMKAAQAEFEKAEGMHDVRAEEADAILVGESFTTDYERPRS